MVPSLTPLPALCVDACPPLTTSDVSPRAACCFFRVFLCFFLCVGARVPFAVRCRCRCRRRQALYDTFSLFGNILSCKVATDDAGESKGYGYVHYETGVSANMAITKINGMLIAGKQVRLLSLAAAAAACLTRTG